MKTMQPPLRPLLDQVINRIFASGRITKADENTFLWATLADEPLSREEMHQVRRVLERLQMGLIKVVD